MRKNTKLNKAPHLVDIEQKWSKTTKPPVEIERILTYKKSEVMKIPSTIPEILNESFNELDLDVMAKRMMEHNANMNKRVQTKLASFSKSTKSDMEERMHFLRRTDRIDCRANGIGSKGGHIAREMKSPGPTNGHTPIGEADTYIGHFIYH